MQSVYFECKMRGKIDPKKIFSSENCRFFVEFTTVHINGAPQKQNGKILYSVLWQAEQKMLSFLEEKYIEDIVISWDSYEDQSKAVLLSSYRIFIDHYSK